jgi:hypothetical protein
VNTRPQWQSGWSLPSWGSSGDAAGWWDQTAWWTTPNFSRTPQRALIQLLEAVAGRFTGRELSLEIRERPVSLRVDAVRVRRPEDEQAAPPGDDPLRWFADAPGVGSLMRWSRGVMRVTPGDDAAPVDAVEVDASDVHVDGLPVGSAAVRIDGMRLDPRVPLPELVTGAIELDVQTTRLRVVEWLRRQFPNWDIRVRPNDLVTVRLPRPRVRVLLRPTIEGRTIRVDTIGVVVLGREIRFPRSMVRTRVYELPPLDPSLEVLDVRVEGEDVGVRVRHDGIRRALRLDTVRNAVRDGASKLADAVLR